MSPILTVFSLIFLGAIVGLVSSFLGIGGGVIIIPTIFSLFKNIEPKEVIAISQGVIFFTAIVNIINYKKKRYSIDNGIYIALISSAIIGAFFTTILLGLMNAKFIKFAFIITLLVATFELLLRSKRDSSGKNSKEGENFFKIFSIGLFGGIISALTGLGGGVAIIPLLITFTRIKIEKLPLYSNTAMCFNAGTALLVHLFQSRISESTSYMPDFLVKFKFGNVYTLVVFLILLAVPITSKIGIHLIDVVPQRVKRILFALLLLAVVIKIGLTI